MSTNTKEINLLHTLRKESGSELQIDIWYEGEIWIFHPIGTIDTGTSGDLEVTLMEGIEQGMKWIIMDMTDVRYISSAGLRVLILGAKNLKMKNGKLKFSTLNNTVNNIIEMSGLKKVFQVYPDNKSAIASFTEIK